MDNSSRRKLTGVVTSNKATKTVIVKVSAIKQHPKYHKRYTVFKKYPAHNELEGINIGDKVVIEESRPISKTKNWKVISKL